YHDGSLVVVGSGGGSSGGASGVGGATGSTGGATGTTGGATSSGGAVGSGGAMEDPCTDIQHPDHTDKPCSEVAGWGECDSDWMQGYCDTTCGRCTPSNSGGADGSGGALGSDNPYPPITNPEGATHATRYWDCCKPSCGWSSQGNIHSCDLNNNNVGVNDGVKSVCDGGQGQTCHGMAPWAHSTEVSYGFVAANGRPCGACYQMQFTGQGEHKANDPGSQAIAGKTMVVKVTNRGAELGDGHFDLLIPGGGLGMFNGCTSALGIQEGNLGARNGGFMTTCASSGNRLQCIRDNCNQAFANHPDLRDGCLWSADWFQGADNPKFLYQEIPCPAALGGFN